MKILAGSIAQAAETFLHPGYISAYPRPLDPYAYPDTTPTIQLDVAEALRLQGESLAGAAGGAQRSAEAGSAMAGNLSHWPTLMLAVLGATAALALAYLLAERTQKRWRRLLPAGAAVALIGMAVACDDSDLEPLPTHPPWEGVTLRDYEHPEQATQALLHGIIADAITNVGQPIDILPNIQYEVGLPTANLTEGQAYALQTYGIDGWGRLFRLTGEGGSYRVTSAGEDGVFDTADDLSMVVPQCADDSWDQTRHAFYLREHAGEHVVLFHRWIGDHFQYNNQAIAQGLTGGDKFDLFTEAQLTPEQQTAVAAAYTEVGTGLDHEPLVLQVF